MQRRQRRKRTKLGRPKGSGGPPEKVRRHRVAVMLNDAELKKLHRLARRTGEPVSTVAYRLVAKGLR